MTPERRLQSEVPVVYEIIQSCEGNCNSDTSDKSSSSVKDVANNLSGQLESDAFKDTLKEKAKDAGVEDVVATIQIESIAVADEVQVATQTNAAVSFNITLSIPVQNFEEL